MKIEENVSFSALTTLRVGGSARFVLTVTSDEDLQTALAFIRERGLSFVVLGEGSNVLPSDEPYDGAVIRMCVTGIAYEEQGDTVYVTAGAGVGWDELVRACAEHALWGIENLAGIPGSVGAAPVQNIGAYGMELKQTFVRAQVLDAAVGLTESFDAERCRFGYRDSRFKHEPNLIITSVTLSLSKKGEPQIGYADLTRAREEGMDLTTPVSIGESVRAIRSLKFPNLQEFGTAGSFFKNPILTQEQFVRLAERHGAVPSFPQENGIKVPLAFILDRVLQLRGFRKGPAFLFGNQPLVLVADTGATAQDVDALASEIESRVFDATGITIEREVRALTAHEGKIFS